METLCLDLNPSSAIQKGLTKENHTAHQCIEGNSASPRVVRSKWGSSAGHAAFILSTLVTTLVFPYPKVWEGPEEFLVMSLDGLCLPEVHLWTGTLSHPPVAGMQTLAEGGLSTAGGWAPSLTPTACVLQLRPRASRPC